MEKINIAELLKDCPKGMELNCTMFDGVLFDEVVDDEDLDCPILIRTKEGETWNLTKEGCWDDSPSAKCVIFPKGKTTWEGFHKPFKDGDIIYTKHKLGTEFVSIFQIEYKRDICTYWDINLSTNKLIGSLHEGNAFKVFIEKDKVKKQRLATEEEKAKLFQTFIDNGYKWNAETKTLEKLIELKFKVGDRVKHKTRISHGDIVTEIKDTHYILNNELALPFTFQDAYELVPYKFDITTLKPFDEVLVRSCNYQTWTVGMFSFYCEENIHPFACVGGYVSQCIPYEENKHLLGTTDDCDEFYKTWE